MESRQTEFTLENELIIGYVAASCLVATDFAATAGQTACSNMITVPTV